MGLEAREWTLPEPERGMSPCNGSGEIRGGNGSEKAARLSAADGAQKGRVKSGVRSSACSMICEPGGVDKTRAFRNEAISGLLLDFRTIVERRDGREGPNRKDGRVRKRSSCAPGRRLRMQPVNARAGASEILGSLQEQDHQDDGKHAKTSEEMHR